MAHTENTIQNRKYKHLSPFERGEIAALHKEGHSNREIGVYCIIKVPSIATKMLEGCTNKKGLPVQTKYLTVNSD